MLEFFATIGSAICTLLSSKRQSESLESLERTMDRLSDSIDRLASSENASKAKESLNRNAEPIYETVVRVDRFLDDRKRSDDEYLRDLTYEELFMRFGPRLGRIEQVEGRFVRRG